MTVTNTRVLITGGASGFGQALAKLYAGRGANALVSDLAETVAPALLPHFFDGGSVAYLQLDTRDIDG